MSEAEVGGAARPGAARLPFYYGWVMLVVAALAMTATLPGRTHGLGLITKPLLEDLKIDEVTFGVINFWSIILGAAFCWPVGRIIDRYGSRGTLTAVAALLGLVVILTGWVTEPLALFVALTFTRGLGQGALSVLSTTLVGKWFTRRIALAMGVFAVLLAIGFIGSILGMGAAIKSSGWRVAWTQMGWLLLFGMAPIAFVLTRSTPASVGLADDNFLQEGEPLDPRIDLSLAAALASPAFWAFSAASVLFNFAWSAITLYNESILAARGFSRDYFYLIMAILTGVGLVANLGGGWLATRWPLGRVLALGMGLFALSLLVFLWVQNVAQLVGYAITLGLASGLITVVHFAFHPQAFGRTHLGQIQGFYQVISVFVSAAGPLVLAQCKEWTGSYETLFNAVAPLSLLLAAVTLIVPLPVRRLREATVPANPVPLGSSA